jgi:predicted  nucleic acid-binding Zn-ribbon protein
MAEQKTPEQQMLERIDGLKDKIEGLQSRVRLSDLRDQVEDIDTKIKSLRPCVQELREHGYVFGKGLEERAGEYARQWSGVRPRVVYEIERQGPDLVRELQPMAEQLTQIHGSGSPLAAKPAVDRLESLVETLESKVEAVARSLEGMFDSLKTEIGKCKAELDEIRKMLDAFAAAAAAGSFRLLPTEGALMAVKATFSRDLKMDQNDPQGFLFLTDQRLLFEQNQEVATKKVLFITTEKQRVQKLLFETPVALIEQVQATKKGLFGHEDHLAFTFKPGAPLYQAWLHLDGQDCNTWQTQIGRARSGDLQGDRAVAVDQAEVEKVKAAPTQCPNCGAPVNQVVLRGVDSITCEYCKHVMRL